MDPGRFDRLAVAVGRRTTRRTALGLLAALGVTGGLSTGASAADCLATGKRCGGGRGTCCSGICKGQKKRCRCPQRTCCQCDEGQPVPCTYVESHDACVERCKKLTGSSASSTFSPLPGSQTTVVCKDTECRQSVDCVPFQAI
jgi:hypothetical protein